MTDTAPNAMPGLASDAEFEAARAAAFEAARATPSVPGVPAATSRIETADSLAANEFAVDLDGQRASGILSVSGLMLITDARAGRTQPSITITKLVQRDAALPFNAWLKDSLSNASARRTLSVIALDEGVETRRWTLDNATIASVSYSAFDSTRGDLVEEMLVITGEQLRMDWA